MACGHHTRHIVVGAVNSITGCQLDNKRLAEASVPINYAWRFGWRAATSRPNGHQMKKRAHTKKGEKEENLYVWFVDGQMNGVWPQPQQLTNVQTTTKMATAAAKHIACHTHTRVATIFYALHNCTSYTRTHRHRHVSLILWIPLARHGGTKLRYCDCGFLWHHFPIICHCTLRDCGETGRQIGRHNRRQWRVMHNTHTHTETLRHFGKICLRAALHRRCRHRRH